MSGDDLLRDELSSDLSDAAHASAARISLSFPARFGSVRLARLVASGVGAELGLDVTAVDDLRLVVDEACAILLECSVVETRPRGDVDPAATAEMLELRMAWTAAAITIDVERAGAITSDVPSAMSVAVLDATATTWTVHRPAARVSVVMARERT